MKPTLTTRLVATFKAIAMLFIVGFLGTQFSEAATYYVAQNGSWSNTCA